MTTELNRDAPLYEAELPVRLVGEDAAVVEGERQLTIRLLEGTRPLGQTETPVPNSADGAAGRERNKGGSSCISLEANEESWKIIEYQSGEFKPSDLMFSGS